MQNSSLVLTTDAKPREPHEPSGEPQTLAGRVDPKQMGDRYQPQEPDIPKRSSRKREQQQEAGGAKKRKAGGDTTSVLDIAADFYQPKTKETKAAYESLLNMVMKQFGDQPEDVLRGAAEEVLQALKNENLSDPERRSDIEKLLGSLSENDFATMVSLGKMITDYTPPDQRAGGGEKDTLDDEVGVAVEIEEENEEDAEGENGMADVVQDDAEEEENEEEAPERKVSALHFLLFPSFPFLE